MFNVLLLLVSFKIYSAEVAKEFNYPSYESALKADNRISFTLESTKLGLITSKVVGVAKKFELKFNKETYTLSQVELSLDPKKFDTDNSPRDSKMYEQTLTVINFPKISIFIPQSITLPLNQTEVDAQINIRGKIHPIKIKMTAAMNENELKVKFDSILGIKELEIPDPSIAIASVKNEITIDGEFKISLK